jgi:mercuric ion transport protein
MRATAGAARGCFPADFRFRIIGPTISQEEAALERGARTAYLVVAWVFVACVVIQFFLAGLGVFDEPAQFETHRNFGYTFGFLVLVLLVLALIGRQPRRQFLGGTLLLVLLFALQSIFVGMRESNPTVAALHPLNGALILILSLVLATRSRQFVPAPLGVEPPMP